MQLHGWQIRRALRRMALLMALVGPIAATALAESGDVREAENIKKIGMEISALQTQHTPWATQSLEAYQHHEHPLVRLWSAAALLNRARTAASLERAWRQAQAQVSRPATQIPGQRPDRPLLKPMRAQLMRLAVSEPDQVFGVAVRHGLLSSELGDLYMRMEPTLLVSLAFVDPDPRVRRAATGLLGRHQDREAARASFVQRLTPDLRTRPAAVPWQGGPLFLPSAGWTGTERAQLLASLVYWQVEARNRQDSAAESQARNALRALHPQLAAVL